MNEVLYAQSFEEVGLVDAESFLLLADNGSLQIRIGVIDDYYKREDYYKTASITIRRGGGRSARRRFKRENLRAGGNAFLALGIGDGVSLFLLVLCFSCAFLNCCGFSAATVAPAAVLRKADINKDGSVFVSYEAHTDSIGNGKTTTLAVSRGRQRSGSHRGQLPAVVLLARKNLASRDPSLPDIPYENHPFDAHHARKRDSATRHQLRRMEEESWGDGRTYSPIRIKFDLTEVEALRSDASHSVAIRLDAITDHILPRVRDFWSSRLSVIPVSKKFGAGGFEESCSPFVSVRRATPRNWKERDGDVYDLIIFVTARDIYFGQDACPTDVTAFAYVCELDQHDRPVVGTINFCLGSIEATKMSTVDVEGDAEEELFINQGEIDDKVKVAVHETGHVLGMGYDYLKYFRNATTGEPLTPRPFEESIVDCVDGSRRVEVLPSENTLKAGVDGRGRGYFEVVTERVRTVVRNQFDCPSMEGARLENQPTNPLDCFGSHWEERLFATESMSAVYDPITNVLSPLTLAFLEDTGFYLANYSMSQVSPFGHGAGCGFVDGNCIDDETGKVPVHGRGFFCDGQGTVNEEGVLVGVGSCDPSHSHVAVCDLAMIDEEKVMPPVEGQYFGQTNLGPYYFPLADHCPMPILSTRDCEDPKSDVTSLLKEYTGPGSMCLNAEFHSISASSSSSSAHIQTPVCLEAKCNDKDLTLEVTIGDKRIICSEDFQKHSYPGLSGKLECPRLAAACPSMFCPANCAGRGVCDYGRLSMSKSSTYAGTGKGKPKCVCFDPMDESPGCFGTTKSSFPATTPSLTSFVSIPTLAAKEGTMEVPEETQSTFVDSTSSPTSTVSPYAIAGSTTILEDDGLLRKEEPPKGGESTTSTIMMKPTGGSLSSTTISPTTSSQPTHGLLPTGDDIDDEGDTSDDGFWDLISDSAEGLWEKITSSAGLGSSGNWLVRNGEGYRVLLTGWILGLVWASMTVMWIIEI